MFSVCVYVIVSGSVCVLGKRQIKGTCDHWLRVGAIFRAQMILCESQPATSHFKICIKTTV